MKIKEIKVTDVLNFSWKSIVFFFQMIAGIIVGSFELYTSALNSVFIVVVEKIIGFLCFCGIIYGLYLFREYGKGKPAPFELSYGELVTYLFFLYIVATLFLLISKIQKNTELLEKILPKENSHRTVREIENRREVVGFLFLKKNDPKKISYTKNGIKKLINAEFLISMRYGSNDKDGGKYFTPPYNHAGQFFTSGTMPFILHENQESSINAGKIRIRFAKHDLEYRSHKSVYFDMNCSADMFAYVENEFSNKSFFSIGFEGYLFLTRENKDGNLDSRPSFGCDVTIDELKLTNSYFQFFQKREDSKWRDTFGDLSEYGIQNHIYELKRRISWLESGVAKRVGMDNDYPIEREIEILKKELEISENFETDDLSDEE